MRHVFVINGNENAFPKEFGCPCARCARTAHVANTSASLISLDASGQPAHHVLFDIGGGVMDSLAANPLFAGGRARLDLIALTHWHADHAGELHRLAYSVQRVAQRNGREFKRIPLWCREESAAHVQRDHAFAWQHTLAPITSGERHPAGHVLPVVPTSLPGFAITPISQYHSSADISAADPNVHANCCAGFVIEIGRSKAVVLWDLDATNDWILHGSPAATLASHADYVFVDCNTWRALTNPPTGRPTNHASFFTVMDYMRALRPKHTVLMHLSNHEDAPGDGFGWTDDEMQQNAQREWAARNLPGDVCVPHIGQQFDL